MGPQGGGWGGADPGSPWAAGSRRGSGQQRDWERHGVSWLREAWPESEAQRSSRLSAVTQGLGPHHRCPQPSCPVALGMRLTLRVGFAGALGVPPEVWSCPSSAPPSATALSPALATQPWFSAPCAGPVHLHTQPVILPQLLVGSWAPAALRGSGPGSRVGTVPGPNPAVTPSPRCGVWVEKGRCTPPGQWAGRPDPVSAAPCLLPQEGVGEHPPAPRLGNGQRCQPGSPLL